MTKNIQPGIEDCHQIKFTNGERATNCLVARYEPAGVIVDFYAPTELPRDSEGIKQPCDYRRFIPYHMITYIEEVTPDFGEEGQTHG